MGGDWDQDVRGVRMGLEGLEPSWVLPRRILSPLRLPIPPQARDLSVAACLSVGSE